MPSYGYECGACGPFQELRPMSRHADPAVCPGCGGAAARVYSGDVGIVFGNPRDTSKWDNFSYRAGFNMEKAKGERRAAVEAAGGIDPYRRLAAMEARDLETRGVFAPGGVDAEGPAQLTMPAGGAADTHPTIRPG